MLPPEKTLLAQVYRANDRTITCRVCSAGHNDTYIFRRGWPVAEVVDVEPKESARLVAEGASVCLCNRCGQAFRKRASVLNAREAMLQMISEFAHEEAFNKVVDGFDVFGGVDDANVETDMNLSRERISVQPAKRQKSIPYHDVCQDEDGGPILGRGLCGQTSHSTTSLKRRSKQRSQTEAEKEALRTIAVASANSGPTEYTGYGVTKTTSEECRFTFFWLHKNNRTKPLLVSVGIDKRKSGHFTYQRAPGLPDSVPALNCSSRRQVLAWILTHFSVANRQVNARIRKQLPVIGVEEACALVRSDGIETTPGAVGEDGKPPMVHTKAAGICASTPLKLPSRHVDRSAMKLMDMATSKSMTDVADPREGSKAANSEPPSPLSLLNVSGLEIPSPFDLMMDIPSNMVPANSLNSLNSLNSPTRRNVGLTLPTYSSEEPEMETIHIRCTPTPTPTPTPKRCGACGLSDHGTPNCPLNGAESVSISSPHPSGDGLDGSGSLKPPIRRSGDPKTGVIESNALDGLCDIDGKLFLSFDTLYDIGCWSEHQSPEIKTENCSSAWASSPPSAPHVSLLIDATSAVLKNPRSHVDDIESALRKLDRSNPSLKELADSGIVGTVAQLVGSSSAKQVTDTARALCQKWLSQAEAAVQEISHRG